jgi:ATP-dependent DNA helicase RecG
LIALTVKRSRGHRNSEMIEQIKIDDTEAKRILDLEENHYLDLKSADIAPAKLTEAVSAFANTAGGELFIGIEESDP